MNRADAITRTERRRSCRSALLWALLLPLVLHAQAIQSPEGGELRVDWSTSDAGGASASGGTFTVTGTIAQLDADPLQPSSGGTFALTGGFWPIAPDAPATDQVFRDGFE